MASLTNDHPVIGSGNKQAVARLLKETILQLCRTNVLFSGGGPVEIDGIICISGQVEGQELVVKVHEVLRGGGISAVTSIPESTQQHHVAFGTHQPGSKASGGFFNHRDLFPAGFINEMGYARSGDSSGGGIVSDSKRRRLDGIDILQGTTAIPPPPPHPSALYAYLSRFGYDPLGVRVSSASGSAGFGASPSEVDFRRLAAVVGVGELSTKLHHHSLSTGVDSPPSARRQHVHVVNSLDQSPSPSSSAAAAASFRAPSSPPRQCDDQTAMETRGVTVRPKSASTYPRSDGPVADGSVPLLMRTPLSGPKRRSMERWSSPSRRGPPPLLHAIPSSHMTQTIVQAGSSLVVPQCIACGFHFDSAEALGEHNESAHSIFTCLCCFKTFTSRSNLERHSRLHTGHRPYACPVCGKTFSRKDHLSNHATKHAYKCAACSRRCADRGALAEHFRSEHGGAALAAVCAYCNKGFGSMEMFEEHVKVHPQFHATPTSNSTAATVSNGDLQRYADDLSTSVGPSSSPFPAQYHHRPQRHPYHNGHSGIVGDVDVSSESGLVFSSTPSLAQRVHGSSSSVHARYGSSSFLGGENGLDVTTSIRLPDDSTKMLSCSVCHQRCSTVLGLRQHEMLHLYELADGAIRASRSFSDRNYENDESGSSRGRQPEQKRSYDCHHCDLQFNSYADMYEHLDSLAANDEGVSEVSVEESAVIQHREKRKQKQPKPLMMVENIIDEVSHDGEDEEVNVVSPEAHNEVRVFPNEADQDSGDEPLPIDDQSAGDVDNHSRPRPAAEIKMEPIRSIMNRSSGRPRERQRNDLPSFAHRDRSSERDGVNTETDVERTELITPASRGGPKGDNNGINSEDLVLHDRQPLGISKSNENPVHSSVLMQSCPDEHVANNNNNGSIKNENVWIDSSNPFGINVNGIGPQRCVVCGLECTDFADLEAHCVAEHSRSPCMFCAKTFAQKANRDRHVCLHTGDRPYRCPECDERFSRGDKLKMHRVRTHGISYPLYGSRGGHHRAVGNRSSPSPSSCSYAGDLGGFDGGGDVDSSGAQDLDSHSPSVSTELRKCSEAWGSVVGEWGDLRVENGRSSGDPSVHPWNLIGSRFPKMEVLADDEGREDTVSGSA